MSVLLMQLVFLMENFTLVLKIIKKSSLRFRIIQKHDTLGTLRITAEAYPVEDEAQNQAAYESTKKDYAGTDCAALELKNVHGTIQNKLGEVINVEF